ncbi:Hypothetical predicted protein, partial [Paramuricea clavata]
ADALPETEPPLAESIKTVSENRIDFNPSSPEYHTCACRSYTANLKDVKLDIAVIQKQIESINRVIDSTNDIIESMSVILNPSGTEIHHISYDLRVETLLREFSSILNEKNRELEQRDNIINSIQEKLIKVDNEYQNVEFLVAERREQEQCQHNRNHNGLIHNESRSIFPKIQAGDTNINMQNQETSENLHPVNNKEIVQIKALPQKIKSGFKDSVELKLQINLCHTNHLSLDLMNVLS